MNEQEQRIAIAGVMGWSGVRRFTEYDGSSFLVGTLGAGDCNVSQTVPDYLNDLNACHEFEKTLFSGGNKNVCPYIDELHKIKVTWLLHATAAQRCEAFLKTLNLWTS